MSRNVELLLYLYAESPVHAGASDSLDVIDLPVQREAATTYPVIWGQSLKGALRQAAEDAGADAGWSTERITAVFGRSVDPDSRGELEAGQLAVGDAQLVAIPVPALRRTFAWATSGIALNRLRRKYAVLGGADLPVPDTDDDRGRGVDAGWSAAPNEQVLGPCVVEVGPDDDGTLRAWATRIADDGVGDRAGLSAFAAKLRQDLLLVGDSVLPLLLKECTELSARVQLTDGKTVKHGPFYSEYLPAETIMAATLSLRTPAGGRGRGTGEGGDPAKRDTARDAEREAQRAALRGLFAGGPVQVGGDETLGKGLMWARLVEAAQ